MASPTTSQLPKPRSWDEFEDIVSDVLRELWKDNYITRNGRQGQKQNGVDIYGRPSNLGGKYAGAQCKLTDTISFQTIEEEVTKSEAFRPELAEYIIATTMSRDAGLQEDVRTHNWQTAVNVMFWEDISMNLSGNPILLEKHFPGWVRGTPSEKRIRQLILASVPKDFQYQSNSLTFFLKSDTDLRIVIDKSDADADEKLFQEEWVESFPDPNAYRQQVHVYYRDTLIWSMLYVSVDGGRHILPAPRGPNLRTISAFKYKIGQIINSAPADFGYDQALHVAGFQVIDEDER